MKERPRKHPSASGALFMRVSRAILGSRRRIFQWVDNEVYYFSGTDPWLTGVHHSGDHLNRDTLVPKLPLGNKENETPPSVEGGVSFIVLILITSTNYCIVTLILIVIGGVTPVRRLVPLVPAKT